jgi:hypothetical protein
MEERTDDHCHEQSDEVAAGVEAEIIGIAACSGSDTDADSATEASTGG